MNTWKIPNYLSISTLCTN